MIKRGTRPGWAIAAAMVMELFVGNAPGQSIAYPWTGFAHTPQHSANASVASQPLQHTHWTTKVDLAWTSGQMDHYGSPLITRSNTVIVPVKSGSTTYEVKGLVASNGATLWTQTTDYTMPPHMWIPSYSPALTPKNRLYYPGAGGTVYYCNTPDSSNAVVSGQMAFYGMANYLASSNTYASTVFIHTPIMSQM